MFHLQGGEEERERLKKLSDIVFLHLQPILPDLLESAEVLGKLEGVEPAVLITFCHTMITCLFDEGYLVLKRKEDSSCR